MDLLDRYAELAVFRGLLARVNAHGGGVMMLTGAAGAGKTSLLTAFADLACTTDFRTRTVMFSRFERSATFDEIGRHPAERYVILVDDLHNADEASIRAVARLAREARRAPVLLVLTVRPTLRLVYAELDADLMDQPHCHRVAIEPVSAAGVVRVARTEFGMVLDELAATALIRVVRGNIPLMKALLADHAATPHRDGRVDLACRTVGQHYRRAVYECYCRFEPGIRDVAQAIAVLKRFSTPRSVAEVAGTTVDVVDQAITGLTAAGLLEDGRFQHSAAGDAILDSLPIQWRAELNYRAAHALRDMGAPAVDIAKRLIEADRADENWVEFLRGEAVAQALALDDRTTAVQALWLSYRSTGVSRLRGHILLRIALIHSARDPELCCQCFHEAHTLLSPSELWQGNSPVLVDQMVRRGRAREALDMLAAHAAREGRDADAEVAELEADRLLVVGEMPMLIGASASLLSEGHRDDRSAIRIPRYLAAGSLVRLLTAEHHVPAAIQAAREALYGCSIDEQTEGAVLAALTTMLYAGAIETMHSLVDKFVDEAILRRAPVWQAKLLAVRAETLLRQGRAAEATADAQQALTLMPPETWGVRIGAPLSTLVLAAVLDGDPERAQQHLARHVPAALFETRYGLHYLFARGHARLAGGRAPAAQADLLSCGRLMMNWGIDRAELVPWRLSAAAAALAQDDQDGAVDLIDRAVEQCAAYYGHTVPTRTGEEEIERRRAARELAFNVLSDGVREDRVFGAIQRLRAEDLQGTQMTGKARYKIEDRYSAYLNKLTQSERQVALLAAGGRSNRNIARSLSITLSTVEQHLTRIYRKLNVAGRQELRARLG